MAQFISHRWVPKMKCFEAEDVFRLVTKQMQGLRLPIVLGQDPKVIPKITGISMLASVDVTEFRINVSVPHLVHLWAASRQYYLYYSAIDKLAKRSITEPLVNNDLFAVQPELKNAIALYAATRSDIPHGKKICHYEGREVCCEDEQCDKIFAICATALLWVMLHETAHLALGHPPNKPNNPVPEKTKIEEETADEVATELFEMLGSENEATQFHYKFGLLVALIELFPPTRKKVGPIYPEYPDRLAEWLFRLDPNTNHEIFSLAALFLKDIAEEWGAHIDDRENQNIQTPQDLFNVAFKYFRILRSLI